MIQVAKVTTVVITPHVKLSKVGDNSINSAHMS